MNYNIMYTCIYLFIYNPLSQHSRLYLTYINNIPLFSFQNNLSAEVALKSTFKNIRI